MFVQELGDKIDAALLSLYADYKRAKPQPIECEQRKPGVHM